jgi:hypothetical protein
MNGVIAVQQGTVPSLAIEELQLLAEASFEGEWEGRVLFIP